MGTDGRYCEVAIPRRALFSASFGDVWERRGVLALTFGIVLPAPDPHMSISTGSFARSCPAAGAGDFGAGDGLLAERANAT